MDLRLCVLIPVHNEAEHIAGLVKAVSQQGFDVIVIDDGSTDDSGSLADQSGAVVLRHDHKQGKGQSLAEGFARALKEEYDGVITMDGDGQHHPQDLDAFLKIIRQHPDGIVAGNRMHSPQGMPWVRLCTNRAMSWLISRICRQTIPDSQCGFRYISRKVLENIRVTVRDFEIETQVLIEASQLGVSIFSVPIQTIYSNERSKINPVKDTLRFLAYMWKVWKTRT